MHGEGFLFVNVRSLILARPYHSANNIFLSQQTRTSLINPETKMKEMGAAEVGYTRTLER